MIEHNAIIVDWMDEMVVLVTVPVYGYGYINYGCINYGCKPYSSLALSVQLQARAIPVPYACMRHHMGA